MHVLRRLTEEDLDSLLKVQETGAVLGLCHIFPQAEHPFPTDSVRARWTRELSSAEKDCFAVIHKGELAGFAATRADEFLHFGTAVDRWGTGLAGAAHDEVLDHLRAQGYKRAWLRVFDENIQAIRFYVRHGWMATEITSRTTYAPFPTLRRYEIQLTPR